MHISFVAQAAKSEHSSTGGGEGSPYPVLPKLRLSAVLACVKNPLRVTMASSASSDPSAPLSSVSGVAFVAGAATSASEKDTTFAISSTDGSERGRSFGVPVRQVSPGYGKLPKKTGRSATPASRGSDYGLEQVRKVSGKPPTPVRSRSISQEALAAHNRRLSSPANGGAGSRSKSNQTTSWVDVGTPVLPTMPDSGTGVVHDDAKSTAPTQFYPMNDGRTDDELESTPSGDGGSGGGPPKRQRSDDVMEADPPSGPPSGPPGGPHGPPGGPGGDPYDLIDFDEAYGQFNQFNQFNQLNQQNQQNNTYVQLDQHNTVNVNPDADKLLQAHDQAMREREANAATTAATAASAAVQSAATVEHYQVLERERAQFAAREAELGARVSATDTELSRVRLELSAASHARNLDGERLEELRADAGKLRSDLQAAVQDVSSLRTQLGQAQADYGGASSKVGELQTVVQRLERDLLESNSQVSQLQSAALQSQTTIADLQRSASAATMKLLEAPSVADGDAEKDKIKEVARDCVKKANKAATDAQGEVMRLKREKSDLESLFKKEKEGWSTRLTQLEDQVKHWKEKCAASVGNADAGKRVLGMAPPTNPTTREDLEKLAKASKIIKESEDRELMVARLLKKTEEDAKVIARLQDSLSNFVERSAFEGLRRVASKTAGGGGGDDDDDGGSDDDDDYEEEDEEEYGTANGDAENDDGIGCGIDFDDDRKDKKDKKDNKDKGRKEKKSKKNKKKKGNTSKKKGRHSSPGSDSSDSSSSSSSSTSGGAKRTSKGHKSAGFAGACDDLPQGCSHALKKVFEMAYAPNPVYDHLKVTEQERVQVPAFPHSGTIKQWFADVASSALAAAGRPDHLVTHYLMLATNSAVPDEELVYVPGVLISIDRKLSNALIKVAEGDFKTHLLTLNEQSFRTRYQPLPSTMVLRLISRHLSTNKSLKAYTSIRDFDYVEYKGIAKLEAFKNNFMAIVRESADELSNGTLCEILLGKIEGKEPALEPDCAAWRRMEEDDPNRNLDWLVKAMNRAIEVFKSRKNQKDRQDYYAGNHVRRGGTQMQVAEKDKDGDGKKKRRTRMEPVRKVLPMAEQEERNSQVKVKVTAKVKVKAKVKVNEIGALAILGSCLLRLRVRCYSAKMRKVRGCVFGSTSQQVAQMGTNAPGHMPQSQMKRRN